MRIHLIKTSDYPIEEFIEVIDLLRSFNGPLEFISSSHEFRQQDFHFLNRHIDRKEFHSDDFKKKSLSHMYNNYRSNGEEFFSLCDNYRDTFNVPINDFVILLTNRRNELNWFSMFELKKNAFIHCDDWEHFTSAPAQYPIAYEVVANILRCLMNPEIDLLSTYFHDKNIGCMNDLCIDKTAIILKLKSADICRTCHEKLLFEQNDETLIDQAFEIFEGIRGQFLFRQGLKRHVKISTIKLTERKKLLLPDLGNLEIKLYPLYKTLYVFYLNHLEGVRLNELSDHKQELLSLYRKFSVSDSDAEIIARIDDLINPHSGSFSQKKSHLNKTILKLLGSKLAPFYRIEGEPGERFKINLSPSQVDLSEINQTAVL